MKEYEVYRGDDLDLVTVIHARTYGSAVWQAKQMGYGDGFRIVEVEECRSYSTYGPYKRRNEHGRE